MLFRILLGCFCCRTPCHVTTKKWVTKQSRTFLWYSHSSVCFAVAINLFRDMCPHVLQIHKLLFSVGLEWTKFRNSRTLSAKCRDQGPRSARPDTCVYPWLCWYCPFVQIVAQASSQSSQKLEAEKDKDPSENYANINQINFNNIEHCCCWIMRSSRRILFRHLTNLGKNMKEKPRTEFISKWNVNESLL